MPTSNFCEAEQIADRPRLDRWFWVAMLITAMVVIPRCVLVTRAHSESVDEPAHVERGLAFVYGNPGRKLIEMNDPPFGDVLIVLPMVVMGANPADPIVWQNWPGGKPANQPTLRPDLAKRLRIIRTEVFYGYARSPEALRMGIAIWLAILFIPFGGLVFHIARRIYGLHAAWLALAMLLIDPTFAGHTGIATLDVIGVEAITLACLMLWRYWEKPTRRRLIVAAMTVGLAFAIKHTATALPMILMGYGLVFWWRKRMQEKPGTRDKAARDKGIQNENQNIVIAPSPCTQGEGRGGGSPLAVLPPCPLSLPFSTFNSDPLPTPPPEYKRRELRRVINDVGLFLLIFTLVIWASALFDFSAPRNWMWPVSYAPGGGFQFMRDFFDRLLDVSWPAGTYVGSFLGGMSHAHRGHWGFLWGENRAPGGWWYYFPVLATYKIPVGFFFIFLLAIISLIWVRPRFEEWLVVVPILVFCAMLFITKIDIGFRHFLPALVFIYILAARCVAPPLNKRAWIVALGWIGCGAAAAHVISYHPDYMSYINFPRKEVWRDIGDSNIDWGQTIKQVGPWLDAHPTNQPVYLACFLNEMPITYYLDHRVIVTRAALGIPRHGILIISPNLVDSIYDWYDSYAALRRQKPIAIIGHSMLVYDLDRMHQP